MATQSTKGASASTKVNNNGGTTINARPQGSGNPISNDLTLGDLGGDGEYGSQVVKLDADSDNDFADDHGVIEAVPSAQFASNNDNDNFIIRGAGPIRAGKINGSGTSLLTSPGAEFAGVSRMNENTIQSAEKLGNPQWTWPQLPGSGRNPGLVEGVDTGDVYNFSSTTDGSAASDDKVVAATRAVPGEVTYRTGAPAPATTNLKPRDAAEQ